MSTSVEPRPLGSLMEPGEEAGATGVQRDAGQKPSPLKVVAVSVLALAAIAAVLGAMILLRPDPRSVMKEESRLRPMIDAASGRVFTRYRMEDGQTIPFENPDTGQATLYPAELCFWTKDGKAKLDPTYVLLNEYVGKPGPTMCPDCGRRVVQHNAIPSAELMAEAAKVAP